MPKNNISADITIGLAAYAASLNALMLAYGAAKYGNALDGIAIEMRSKYARVVRVNSKSPDCGRVVIGKAKLVVSSYAYVDLESGHVVKGNWKSVESAVLHIKRGNVADGSWLNWHGPFGIGYCDSHGEFRRMLDDADYMVACDAIKSGNLDGAAATLAAAIADRYAVQAGA